MEIFTRINDLYCLAKKPPVYVASRSDCDHVFTFPSTIKFPDMIQTKCTDYRFNKPCNHLYDQFIKLLNNEIDAAAANRRMGICMNRIYGEYSGWSASTWECRSELQLLIIETTQEAAHRSRLAVDSTA